MASVPGCPMARITGFPNGDFCVRIGPEFAQDLVNGIVWYDFLFDDVKDPRPGNLVSFEKIGHFELTLGSLHFAVGIEVSKTFTLRTIANGSSSQA
jgi:hypothetical protein